MRQRLLLAAYRALFRSLPQSISQGTKVPVSVVDIPRDELLGVGELDLDGRYMTSRPKAIRIAVADSNQMACRLLSDALQKQPGIVVVASVANAESLLQAVLTDKPDVALIASALVNGPFHRNSSTDESRAQAPQCPWILLLDQSEPQVVVAAFRAGAKGVFSRSQSDISLLAKCIRRVAEGQIWVDNKQMLYLLDAFTGNRDEIHNRPSAPVKLTPREESVVRLVVQGMVNREIAAALHLSEHTIKNYMFRIFDKLGVSNRVELALYAVAKLDLAEPAA
jgi:DNA-binding NarL/FixJ family response regulator